MAVSIPVQVQEKHQIESGGAGDGWLLSCCGGSLDRVTPFFFPADGDFMEMSTTFFIFLLALRRRGCKVNSLPLVVV